MKSFLIICSLFLLFGICLGVEMLDGEKDELEDIPENDDD